jgi:hypothetical protein
MAEMTPLTISETLFAVPVDSVVGSFDFKNFGAIWNEEMAVRASGSTTS